MSWINIAIGGDQKLELVGEMAGWLKLAAPALISAFLSGYLISRYRSREDNLDKRCDELCSEIDKVASLAEVYWSKSARELQEGSGTLSDATIKVKLQKIAGIRVMIEQFMSRAAANELVVEEQKLLRCITGGDFGVHTRSSDIERARTVQYVATEYLVAVRNSRMNDVRGWKRRS